MTNSVLLLAALIIVSPQLPGMVISADTQADASVRMAQLEEKVSKMELDHRAYRLELESRLTRLENGCCPSQFVQSPDTRSNVSPPFGDLVDRLEAVTHTLEKMNISCNAPRTGDSSQTMSTQVCERGMAHPVNESFVLLVHATLGKQIRCDADTDGGGWVVIQRRAVGDVDFYRNWTEYREGFGSLTTDFWLGNEAIYQLTNEHPYKLRVDLRVRGRQLYAEYDSFRIEDETNKYRLHLGSFSGTVGENGTYAGMSYGNKMPFSTFDQDNDARSPGSCAVDWHGGWWYAFCTGANLNGKWGKTDSNGLYWYSTWMTWMYPSFIEMKIRRI